MGGREGESVIEDRDALAATPARETALACLEAGIRAARPGPAVRADFERAGDRLRAGAGGKDCEHDLAAFDRVLLLGIGKAAPGAADALAGLVAPDAGLLATDAPADTPPGVECVAGGHPTPDAGSVRAGERALELLRGADDRTLVLAAITGGGSALLAAPAGDVTLDALASVTDALLSAGASIDELNAVRKHCSRVKGGRLARAAAPATTLACVVSDVVGDDLGTIASGPFAPDPTTLADARAVLDEYDVDAPPSVRAHLAEAVGERAERETPKPGDPAFDRVTHRVVANGRTALEAARERARERGYGTLVVSSHVEGEAREVGRLYPAMARDAREHGDPVEPPAVVLAAGETTVTVRGDGRGGPNAECALAAAPGLPAETALACVDTDGRDGATGAAGALVDGGTATRTRARGALAANDAGGLLADRGALVRTGATGTNVNDLHVLVVGF